MAAARAKSVRAGRGIFLSNPQKEQGMSTNATMAERPQPSTVGEVERPQPFAADEISRFQKDDKHAGGAVVCLMAAIFTIGLILYTVIACLAFRGSS